MPMMLWKAVQTACGSLPWPQVKCRPVCVVSRNSNTSGNLHTSMFAPEIREGGGDAFFTRSGNSASLPVTTTHYRFNSLQQTNRKICGPCCWVNARKLRKQTRLTPTRAEPISALGGQLAINCCCSHRFRLRYYLTPVAEPWFEATHAHPVPGLAGKACWRLASA